MTRYSYEDALSQSVIYFDGDELAAKVFLDKYALRDESGNILEDTPTAMHKRIAKELARIESKKFNRPYSKDYIFSLMDKFKYVVPQGSILYGCGNPYSITSLSNCYVVESPCDSYGGILRADQHLVQISKRRGGVGIDLSKLRPKGSSTKNAARSSTGIISWMERYSNSIREVGQDGRRGALMLTVSVHHPDILDFITIKNDPTKVTGANISVRLTNEFLRAVEKDEEYELRFPVNSKNVINKVKAKDIWNTIIRSAWLRAEPGLLFWDDIIDYNAVDCYGDVGFETVSTNPCQPEWATVLTPNGISDIGSIKIGDTIWSENGWTKVVNKWKSGIKDVYGYYTTSGTFYGTQNHKIVQNGEKVEAKDAESIDFLRGPTCSVIELDPQIVMDGMVIGDGTVHKASNNLVCLIIGDNDKDYFNSEISNLIIKDRSGIGLGYWEVKTNIRYDELPYTYKRQIPTIYFNGDVGTVCSFLRGLYSANGSVVDGRVTLKSSSDDIIRQVQIMLSSIGISSYYTTNKPSKVKFVNGEYICKVSYDLNISRDRLKFYQLIGFVQKYKNEKLCQHLDKLSHKPEISSQIRSIDYISTEEVYDITVDNDNHTYWSGGLNISNCSELPLCYNDSCRLLLLNLFNYVVHPFTENSRFDHKLFYEHSKVAQRLMDDIIDLELEKIDGILQKILEDPEKNNIKEEEYNLWCGIKKKCIDGRRTGLGITALGDTLAALGFKYDEDNALVAVDAIFKNLKLAALESSCNMAEEIGPFAVWDWNKEKESMFLLQVKAERPELYEAISKYGRRNIGHLTVAPTGSMSILTQTTSGVEPLFRLNPYIRRKKVNPGDKNVRVDFVDQNGDSWQNFEVYHPRVAQWMKISKNNDLENSPWFGCCAEDIDWPQRVKLQGVIQRHIDHAISSTINLPETVTESEVSTIYMEAWKNRLKGVTVYRNNCRTGVLVDKPEPKQNKKRPKKLKCHIYHPSVKGVKYYAAVGLKEDGYPYEIFVGNNGIDTKSTDGFIQRIREGKYSLISDNEIIIDDMCEQCSDEEEAIARLASIALRNGVEIQSVVDQLEKTKGSLSGFAKVICRILRKYIPEQTRSNDKCPECKNNLVYQEGCKKCVSCGYSKC